MNIKTGDLCCTQAAECMGYAYSEVELDTKSDYRLDPQEPLICLTGVEQFRLSDKVTINMVKVLTMQGIRYVFSSALATKLVNSHEDTHA